MRKHDVQSQIDSDISPKYIQNKTNICTTSHIEKMFLESNLPKEVKLNIIEELIECLKNNV